MNLKLPLPPSINTYYGITKTGIKYKTTKAKDWEKEAGYMCLTQKKYGDQEVSVTLVFSFVDSRSDIDNRVKILLDLLQKQYIFNNDNQVKELHVYSENDRNNPGVTVEVVAL